MSYGKHTIVHRGGDVTPPETRISLVFSSLTTWLLSNKVTEIGRHTSKPQNLKWGVPHLDLLLFIAVREQSHQLLYN